MTKVRVSELAAEFGIGAEEVLTMLRAMDISVRTPASPLTDEQVARARVRWEREKRNRTEPSGTPEKAPAKKKAAAKATADEAKPAAKKKVAAKAAPAPV